MVPVVSAVSDGDIGRDPRLHCLVVNNNWRSWNTSCPKCSLCSEASEEIHQTKNGKFPSNFVGNILNNVLP